jgi:hypothetical protein
MSRQSQTAAFPSSDWFIGAVKSNPEGLLLLAAGCALLMRKGGTAERQVGRKAHAQGGQRGPQRQGTNASASSKGIGENMSQMAETATEYASDLTEKITETAGSYASSVSDYAGEARRTVSEGSAEIGRQAQTNFQRTVDRVLREQPLAVVLAGLAAGAVVASAFPATEIEKRTLGEAGERLAEAAGEVTERFKDATTQAGERLAEVAEERGLNSDGLKEAARDVAGSFGTAFSGETAKQDTATATPVTGSRSLESGDGQAAGGAGGSTSKPAGTFKSADPFNPGKRGV